MQKRKLIIGVGNAKDAAKEFVDVWHQLEVGKKPKNAPIEKISFNNERQLFKILTPKRCELLRYLHSYGKTTIRSLAKNLQRDYSNVYQDVKELHHVGLILKNKENKYFVPWDMIVTEIPLSILATTKTTRFHKLSNSQVSHRQL